MRVSSSLISLVTLVPMLPALALSGCHGASSTAAARKGVATAAERRKLELAQAAAIAKRTADRSGVEPGYRLSDGMRRRMPDGDGWDFLGTYPGSRVQGDHFFVFVLDDGRAQFRGGK